MVPKLALPLLLFAGGVAAATYWVVSSGGRGTRASSSARAALEDVHERTPEELEALAQQARPPIVLERTAGVALSPARAALVGPIAPPPDTLVALRGRVIDDQTEQPLAGFTLELLSERPRTFLVRTAEDGTFDTGAVLAAGVVSLTHVADLSIPRFASCYEIDPHQVLVPPLLAGSTTRFVMLRAREPRHVLEVDVRLPGGEAAAGASVALSSGAWTPGQDFQPQTRAFEITGADGRARFGLFGPDLFERSYRVEAQALGTLASSVLAIDPPIGMHARRLDLESGGLVHVRCLGDEGRPIAGASVWLSAHDGPRASLGQREETDASGEALYRALRAACYTLVAVHPQTGQRTTREIDLASGEQVEVDLRLSLLGLRLALSGVVHDELGYPLADVELSLQRAGQEPVVLRARENGRFEFWSGHAASVVLVPGGGFLDDRFEPAVGTFPFGTTGIVVRRTARIPLRSVGIEIVDERSHAPVARASVILCFDNPTLGTSVAERVRADAGVAQLSFKMREDLEWIVEAPGFLRAEGRMQELMRTCGEGMPLVVELERGFARRLEVRDRVTRQLLADVTVSEGLRVWGRTDAHGVVELEADEWPALLRLERAGYAPQSFDPAESTWPSKSVWLDPLANSR